MQEIDQEVKKKAQEPVEIAEIPTNLKNTFWYLKIRILSQKI